MYHDRLCSCIVSASSINHINTIALSLGRKVCTHITTVGASNAAPVQQSHTNLGGVEVLLGHGVLDLLQGDLLLAQGGLKVAGVHAQAGVRHLRCGWLASRASDVKKHAVTKKINRVLTCTL